jgi:hypothetical protein
VSGAGLHGTSLIARATSRNHPGALVRFLQSVAAILVTGATGKVGSRLAKRLAQRGALVRDPARAADLREAGIALAEGDLLRPDRPRELRGTTPAGRKLSRRGPGNDAVRRRRLLPINVTYATSPDSRSYETPARARLLATGRKVCVQNDKLPVVASIAHGAKPGPNRTSLAPRRLIS